MLSGGGIIYVIMKWLQDVIWIIPSLRHVWATVLPLSNSKLYNFYSVRAFFFGQVPGNMKNFCKLLVPSDIIIFVANTIWNQIHNKCEEQNWTCTTTCWLMFAETKKSFAHGFHVQNLLGATTRRRLTVYYWQWSIAESTIGSLKLQSSRSDKLGY